MSQHLAEIRIEPIDLNLVSPASLTTNASKEETQKAIRDDDEFYQVFSSLIIDQLNTQDTNVILETQRQMFDLFFFSFVFIYFFAI